MKIDEPAIRKLAKLLDETSLTEIEVTDGDQSVRVSRGSNGVAYAPLPAMDSDPTVPKKANTQAPATVAQNHPGAVTSPMVGTVYMQADPNSPAFVTKGATVKPGDTLIIIEAMKVMNPIKASKGGTVTQILVDNAQPVEYGDVLMVIE